MGSGPVPGRGRSYGVWTWARGIELDPGMPVDGAQWNENGRCADRRRRVPQPMVGRCECRIRAGEGRAAGDGQQ